MIYQIRQINYPKLNKVYEKSIRELDSFFNLNKKYSRPKLFIVSNRKTIDSLRGQKTEDWVVGWEEKESVYLLRDKNYEKESSHKYSDEVYFALLKHELTHYYSKTVSNFARKPVWLLEGICIFLSGQTKLKPKPIQYKNFIDFYETGGSKVYSESGFAVEFLVKRYGKRKLISLLKRAKEANTKREFAKLFKSIYGFDLAYNNFKIL